MNKIFIFLIILLLPVVAFTQPVYILNDSSAATINRYAVLPDRGYTFEKILSDTSLVFIDGDSLQSGDATHFWLKIRINNPFHYAERCSISLNFNLDNALYYFNENTQKWVVSRNGMLSPYIGKRNLNELACVLQGKTENAIYINMDASVLRTFGHAVEPLIKIKKGDYFDRNEHIVWLSWVTSITVLILFFLNNLYIYFGLRDKTVLFYLIAQLGGMFYITAYKRFYGIFFQSPLFTSTVSPNGQLHSFDLTNLLMHGSILLIMYGVVELTRAFLNTRKKLPVMDLALRIGLWVYVLVTVIIVLLNVFVAYLEDYTLLYHNILALLLIAIILSTSVVGYLRKLPASTPFLVANFLPLIFMLGTTLYHVFVSFSETNNSLMPDFSIISQALAFSVALVARTKSVHKNLKAKEIEARQLEFDLKEIGLRQRLIELENQKINVDIRLEKTKNELLEERLELNQRELASTTLYMVQKNELLASLKTQIQELHKLYPDSKHKELKSIESILQSNLYLDGDWRKFKLHFEQVHPHFFENLLAKYPSLTKNEIRLYAYFHINLSTKEIAALLNIDPASVRRAKTRLYKKMAMVEEGDLNDDGK
ncbi:7TM diverse intracellular signaling domain-containing protein [Dyadobacter sp. 3J3]|uniref:7TM diverse intracellular signaling domain-containing protein n=1 Tax=Dyadobacter sp. 3J3 TaxID=2606600 RepID=UPI0013571653|nr:7TM diverse intracellular signaling domain-containing protein [Dyadobacter sp. 3J3]